MPKFDSEFECKSGTSVVWAFEHESPVQFLQAALHFKPEKHDNNYNN